MYRFYQGFTHSSPLAYELRMLDPLIINYGKGHMCSLLSDPDCLIDVVIIYT